MGEGARVFMVSAYDAATLAALLEGQALADMEMEFPDWRAGRADSGGWYAFVRGQADVRLAQDLRVTRLCDTLRALARRNLSSKAQAEAEHMT